jgi:membrane protein implicated in regulation of membrane protease activity
MVIEEYMIWIWLAVFVITVSAEAATQDFVSIWFAVGALIAMAICYFVPWYVEIIIFAVISLTSLILTRPIVKKFMDRTTRYTNVDEFVGKKTILEKTVSKFEAGEVKVNGIIYNAILPEADTEDILKGTVVEIVALRGNKVVVRKTEESEGEENV